jgi:hypothetical protein
VIATSIPHASSPANGLSSSPTNPTSPVHNESSLSIEAGSEAPQAEDQQQPSINAMLAEQV